MTEISPFMRRAASRDNGHHGRQAEKKFSKRVHGTQQPGSGALEGAKGDVKKSTSSFSFLIENKTTKGKSFTLHREWLFKIYQEALEQTRSPALAIQFTNEIGDSEKRERWIMVPESVWMDLIGE